MGAGVELVLVTGWVSLAGVTCGCMIVREEMRAAAEQFTDAAAHWRLACDDWQRAIRVRDAVAKRMDRRVTKTTGGLSVARFEATCRRRFFHDIEDAKAKARAIRARPAVVAAIAERDRGVAIEDAKVRAARIAVTEASKVLVRWGARCLHDRPERARTAPSGPPTSVHLTGLSPCRAGTTKPAGERARR